MSRTFKETNTNLPLPPMAAKPRLTFSSSFPGHLQHKATVCLTEIVIAFLRVKLGQLKGRGCTVTPDLSSLSYMAIPITVTMDGRAIQAYSHNETAASVTIDDTDRKTVKLTTVYKHKLVFCYRINTPSVEDAYLLWVAMDANRPIPAPPAPVARPAPSPLPEPEPTPEGPLPEVSEGPAPEPAPEPQPAPDGPPPGGADEKPVPPPERTKRKYTRRTQVVASTPEAPPEPPAQPEAKKKASGKKMQWHYDRSLTMTELDAVIAAMGQQLDALRKQKAAEEALAKAEADLASAKFAVHAAEKALGKLGVTRS